MKKLDESEQLVADVLDDLIEVKNVAKANQVLELTRWTFPLYDEYLTKVTVCAKEKSGS